jgi:hypothetical protein
LVRGAAAHSAPVASEARSPESGPPGDAHGLVLLNFVLAIENVLRTRPRGTVAAMGLLVS